MNTKDLLKQLQEKAARFDLEALKQEYAVYQFNLETLISLKENEGNFFAEPINERYLMKFRDAINAFMDTHAPGDEEFKDYIRQLNCYRTFILKIPMHPVGMSLDKGKVINKGGQYYCTAKKFYINQENSLCRFCVAKISEL